MNAVLASLVTGGLVAVSSILTLVLNQRHTERLRRMDHRHDHRERLQDKRVTAYREFELAFRRQRRAYGHLATSSLARQLQAEWPDGTPPGPEGDMVSRKRYDRLDEEWQESLLAAIRATEDLEDSLANLQLVATTAVYHQAALLLAATKKAWTIQRERSKALGSRREPTLGDLRRLQEADEAVAAERDALHSACAIELGLETGEASEDVRQRG